MWAAALYFGTAALLLLLAHRFVARVVRGAALVLLLLPLCITGDAVLTSRLLAPVDFVYHWEPFAGHRSELGIQDGVSGPFLDVASQMIPWRAAVRNAIRRGEWPLLNRSILAGDILAAAAQPAAYSPFTLLACLLPAAASFTFTAAITLFVAALGAYLFATDLGCRPVAALTCAAAWMFAGPVTVFAMWPIGFAWTLLPLVFLATRRVLATPSFRHVVLLVVALSLLILAGHPETIVHEVFVGALYGVFELVRAPRRGRALVHVIAAGVLALLVCAVFLLPLLEAIEQTGEYRIRRDFLSQAPLIASGKTVLARTGALLLPFVEDPDSPFRAFRLQPASAVGALVIALAVYAIVRVRRRETYFFAALAVFCALAGFDAAPVARFLHLFPLLNVALNAKLIFAADLALAVLAGLGMEELIRRADRIAGAVIGSVLAVLSAATLWLIPRHTSYRIGTDLVPLAIAAAVLLAIPRWKYISFLILALLVVQRSTTDAWLYPTHRADAAYPWVPVLQRLRDVPRPFRITGGHFALIPNTAAVYDLEDVRGYQAMTFQRLVETYSLWCAPVHMWFNSVPDLNRPFLWMMNVRFAIAPAWMGTPDGWREVLLDGDTRLLENTRALPRAFVPAFVRRGAGDPVAEMSAETDFARRAWVEGPHEWAERPNGPGQVETREAKYGYELLADMNGDGWVIVSQTAWKGWQVRIDGRRSQWQYGNHAFLAVFVPSGHHVVRLEYMPRTFVIGRIVSIVTILGLGAGILWRRRGVILM